MFSCKIKLKNILRFFLTILLLEIVIGGGGRFIEFGTLSLKMIFFSIAIIICLLSITKIKNDILLHIQLALLFLLILATCIAITSDIKISLIFPDISPLLFFFIISFFALAINNYNDIIYVIKIIKIGSIFLSFLYFSILILLYMRYIDFEWFYIWGNKAGEIFFREGNYMFFYKGFLYLCIGFFFHLTTIKNFKDIILTTIMLLGVFFTLSRGLILMTCIVFAFYIFFISKNKWLKLISILFGFLSAIYLLPIYFKAIGDKTDSDQIRIDTFNEVVERINFISLFIGHGFGSGVPTRPEHMEMSYLEVFHKQGLVGLSFFIIILFIIFHFYFKIKKYRDISLAFLLSVCFVYLQSFTNPFVNNPIGISIVSLSIVCLYKLYLLEKSHENNL